MTNVGAMNTEQAVYPDRPVNEALAPGSKLLSGQYEILRYLSSGGFGITYLAKDSLNRTVVIKECFPEAFCSRVNRTVRARSQNYLSDFRSIVKLFIREAYALSRLNHPGVVGVHQVFEDNETAYMALDLVDGQDLLEIVESKTVNLRPAEIRRLTLSLLDAIAHVHGEDLLHRDISPDNILLDKSGQPVLIDFGAAREEASRKSRVLSAVLVVKDGYSPQEFYVAGSQQYPSSDLYALAATLVHLITGEAPPNSQARLSALASNQPDLYIPLSGRYPEYDREYLEAIDTAMKIVPSERLQSAEDWMLMIDHSKRVEIARARAAQDKEIDVTVMNLVKATKETCKSESRSSGPSRSVGVTVSKGASPAVQAPQKKKAVEDLTPDPQFQDALVIFEAEEDESPTPYVRVKSKAIAALEERNGQRLPQPENTKPRMSRYATVPVVFCAYLFYGHIAFQIEQVRNATLGPVLAFATDVSDVGRQDSVITYRRGGMN